MAPVEIGQQFTRMLGGKLPMTMKVKEIEGDVISCNALDAGEDVIWTFDRKTGMEIDEDLQWGPQFGVTGSFLKEIVEYNRENT